MPARRLSLLAALLVCALIGALPARAAASTTEQSILMDDKQIIYGSPSQTEWTLEQAQALGIDRVKVSVVWVLVAPAATSHRKPAFDASDPGAYPLGAWDRYDRVVEEAQALGLKVYFQLTPPAPAWAVARGTPKQGYPWSQKPSAADFRQFAEAVGRRYSGRYVPAGAYGPLPRVSYWGLWNEPNEAAWLNPQWNKRGRGHHAKLLYTAPTIYRRLANAGYDGLRASDHAGDTILIGEIASHGWITPLPFVQALYCVGPRDRPLTGSAAAQIGCPRSGNRRAFVASNPGLFRTTGFAHHPYSFDVSPNTPIPGLVTLENLGSLERTLVAVLRTYGERRGQVPLYLTEWGYKTNPPNPFVNTSLTQQATWLDQGEYMTWRDRYVRSLNQFLLVDDTPRQGAKPGSLSYWSTFQTGLMFADESPKPSYASFRLPIWLPHAEHGRNVAVWAQLRPARATGNHVGVLEYQPSGAGTWSNLRQLTASGPENFLFFHVAIPAAGSVRMAWYDPRVATVYYSRTVRIS